MLELLPDGQTFRKLTKTQTKALDRYYKREKKTSLPLPSLGMALGIPLVLAVGIGSFAYLFKDELQDAVKEEYDSFKDFLFSLPKEMTVAAGGALADIIVDPLAAIGGPTTPEFLTLPSGVKVGPLSICKRWETDAMDTVALINEKGSNITKTETVAGALVIKRIVKAMKKEGCTKPAVISQAQWDD